MISGVLITTYYLGNCSLTAIFVLMQHSYVDSHPCDQLNAIIIVRLQRHALHVSSIDIYV